MSTRRLLTVAALLGSMTLLAAADAEARRGWRQSRWSSQRWTRSYSAPSRTVYARSSTDPVWPSSVRRSSGPITYSGISRAEQDAQRRRDAWYEEAYNGWRPEDFR